MKPIFIFYTNMLVSKYWNFFLCLSCVGVAFVVLWGDQVYYTLRLCCVVGT